MKSCRWSLLAAMLVCTAAARAQYIEPREYEPSDARYLSAGVLWRDFAPLGSNTSPDSLRIRFKRLVPAFSFHQGMVDILLSFGSYDIGGRSLSTIYFGSTIGNDFVVSGRRSSTLIIPMQLAIEYLKAESPGVERDHFNVASLGLGGGLKYQYRSTDLEFSASATETAEYCFEGWNTGSGFSAVTMGNVSLLLRSVRILEGVAIGYRFRYQTWSMSNSRLNARTIDHGPYIGILF